MNFPSFPWKTTESFVWTNLNPLYTTIICVKFGWNLHIGFWEKDKNVKSYRQRRWRRRRTTDKLRTEKLTCTFGSGEFKKKENISSLLIHLHEGKCINIQLSTYFHLIGLNKSFFLKSRIHNPKHSEISSTIYFKDFKGKWVKQSFRPSSIAGYILYVRRFHNSNACINDPRKKKKNFLF